MIFLQSSSATSRYWLLFSGCKLCPLTFGGPSGEFIFLFMSHLLLRMIRGSDNLTGYSREDYTYSQDVVISQ